MFSVFLHTDQEHATRIIEYICTKYSSTSLSISGKLEQYKDLVEISALDSTIPAVWQNFVQQIHQDEILARFCDRLP